MKSKPNKISVLIQERGSDYLPLIVNCLSEAKDVDIYIISNKKNAGIRHSNKIQNYSYYPKEKDELEFISNINNELKKFNIDLVMPICTLGIKTLIKNKDDLLFKDKLVLLPSLETFDKARNKGLLSKHLQKHCILTPRSFIIKSGDSCHSNLDCKFPLLAKPTLGSGGGKGIKKFNNIEELKSSFKETKYKNDYLLEEYIKGYDLGCHVLCKNGKILAYTMKKGTLWTKKPFSPQVGLDFFFNQELYDIIVKLMDSLKWDGVADIDIRYDNESKDFLILEINPRFWATTEASEIAGVNFPYLYCLSSMNIDFEIPNYRHTTFLDFTGVKLKVKQNLLFLFKFKFLLNNTPFRYYKKDPMPIIYTLYFKTRKFFKNLKKNKLSS